MSSFEDVWETKIYPILIKVLEHPNEELIPQNYMIAYSMSYNMLCADKVSGIKVYTLYKEILEKYIKQVIGETKALSDDQLFLFYRIKWTEYLRSNRCNNSILRYLNRTWIEEEKKTKENIYLINELANVVWRENMFKSISTRITTRLLDLIERDRDEIQIDSSLLKDMIDSYIILGASDIKAPLRIYGEFLQKQFLEATENYYSRKAAVFFNTNNFSNYLIQVEEWINRETLFVRRYFHSVTEEKLMNIINKVLIQNYVELFQSNFIIYLQDDKLDDLKRLYTLLSRIERQYDHLPKEFEQYIETTGLAIITKDANEKPDVYVGTMLRIYRKFQSITNNTFKIDVPDPIFMQSMDRSLTKIINTNPITKKIATTNDLEASPQLLAQYCDLVLKKGKTVIVRDDDEMNILLDDLVMIFKYLSDKDVFISAYQKLLAKRLINETSASNDHESAIIQKLRTVQGMDFCTKLNRMMQDKEISLELNQNFKDDCATRGIKLEHDLAINVLGFGIWPFSAPTTPLLLPASLLSSIDIFTNFYKQRNKGRKLTFLHQLSKAQVSVTYVMNGKLRLQTSTYQMVILMTFNQVTGDEISFADLGKYTQLQELPLKVALLGLLKVGILQTDEVTHENWNPESLFSINRAFTSKKIMVSCLVPIDTTSLQTKNEQVVNSAEINQERNFKIKATIVRIMKSTKICGHNELVTELVSQIKKWFQPEISQIKKNIEDLIEQEYMKRVEDERGIFQKKYEYVA